MKSLTDAVRKANRVYLIGNGGSAANAIHIANDLISCGVKAQALLDISTITAIANDYGYEHVFSRQLEVFGSKGDLLVCLTGSGNSPNILEAITKAKEKSMDVMVITGGGKAATMASHILTDDNMQLSEERQLIIGHEVMLSLSRD
ncbi:MAG TPA: SIS domain-containing protein [Nitrososphaera sp.]|nr:SIS domain-containing protein [Nitrososphaera sp.]